MCVKPRNSNVSGLPCPRSVDDRRRTARTRSAASSPGAAPDRTSRTAREGRPGTARASLRCSKPTTKSSAYRARSRRRARAAAATAGPTGRRRSAGRRSPAAARPTPLAASPHRTAVHVPSSMTPAPQPFLDQAQDPACPRSGARGTSAATRGRWCRRTRGCPRRAPSSPSCAGSRPRARPARHAASAPAGTRTRSRGSPPRRWRSAPRPPPAGRSCPPAQRPRAAAAARRPSGCTPSETASLGTRPGEPGRADPEGSSSRSCP